MKGAGITLQLVLGTPYWVGVVALGVVVSCQHRHGRDERRHVRSVLSVLAEALRDRDSRAGTAGSRCPRLDQRICRRTRSPSSPTRTTVGRATRHTFTCPGPRRRTVTGRLVTPSSPGRRYTCARDCTPRELARCWRSAPDRPGPGQPRHGSGTRRNVGLPVSHRGHRAARTRWLATYGVIIATFFGAIGLPHILVRFYTNPDGEAARRTTLIVVLLLSTLLPLPHRLGRAGQAARTGALPVQRPGQHRPRPAFAAHARPARRTAGGAGRGRRFRRLPVHLVRPAGQRRRCAVA